MLSFWALKCPALRKWHHISLRTAFSYKYEGVPFKNNITKAFDVDAAVQSASEASDIQLHKKGCLGANEMKADGQIAQLEGKPRKKRKPSPREKYMFKKITQRLRDRPHPDDPASDLNPLYEMTRPWWGFSSSKETKDTDKSEKAEEHYTEKEQIAISSIRRTIEHSQPPSAMQHKTSEHDEGTLTEMQLCRRTSLNYFRSAENIAQSPEENVLEWNEALAERIAKRLHKYDTKSQHPFSKGIATETPVSHPDLDKALSEDPSFQKAALKLEAEAKELQDVDQWIEKLREFAAEHEGVLEAMDTNARSFENDVHSDKNPSGLGVPAETIRLRMIETGIDVSALEKQAQEELESEYLRTEDRTGLPTDTA